MANKGEWSELYVLLALLAQQYLVSADKDGHPIPNKKSKIKSIKRGFTRFDLGPDGAINIYDKVVLLGSSNVSIIQKYLADMLKAIQTEKKPNNIVAFENLKAEFLSYANIDSCYESKIFQLKAPSSSKSDIEIVIDDPRVDVNNYLGFSIKSYLGSNPTLFNASHATKIRYTIIEWNSDDYMQTEIKGMDYASTKEYIIQNHKQLVYDSMVSNLFRDNLRLIDDIMPVLISYITEFFYLGDGKSVKEITHYLEKKDPLKAASIPGYYEKKIKDFLVAVALGMKPASKDWEGMEEASGGFIVVNSDGSIVCYHLYDRDNFREYLFQHTSLDTPASSKYLLKDEPKNFKDGIVHKENGKDIITLNLQVRFFGEDTTKKKK